MGKGVMGKGGRLMGWVWGGDAMTKDTGGWVGLRMRNVERAG